MAPKAPPKGGGNTRFAPDAEEPVDLPDIEVQVPEVGVATIIVNGRLPVPPPQATPAEGEAPPPADATPPFDAAGKFATWAREISANPPAEGEPHPLGDSPVAKSRVIVLTKEDLSPFAVENGWRDPKEGGDLPASIIYKCVKKLQDDWVSALKIKKTNALKKEKAAALEKEKEEKDNEGGEKPSDASPPSPDSSATSSLDVILIISDLLPLKEASAEPTPEAEAAYVSALTEHFSLMSEEGVSVSSLIYLDPASEKTSPTEYADVSLIPPLVSEFHQAVQKAPAQSPLANAVLLRLQDIAARFKEETAEALALEVLRKASGLETDRAEFKAFLQSRTTTSVPLLSADAAGKQEGESAAAADSSEAKEKETAEDAGGEGATGDGTGEVKADKGTADFRDMRLLLSSTLLPKGADPRSSPSLEWAKSATATAIGGGGITQKTDTGPPLAHPAGSTGRSLETVPIVPSRDGVTLRHFGRTFPGGESVVESSKKVFEYRKAPGHRRQFLPEFATLPPERRAALRTRIYPFLDWLPSCQIEHNLLIREFRLLFERCQTERPWKFLDRVFVERIPKDLVAQAVGEALGSCEAFVASAYFERRDALILALHHRSLPAKAVWHSWKAPWQCAPSFPEWLSFLRQQTGEKDKEAESTGLFSLDARTFGHLRAVEKMLSPADGSVVICTKMHRGATSAVEFPPNAEKLPVTEEEIAARKKAEKKKPRRGQEEEPPKDPFEPPPDPPVFIPPPLVEDRKAVVFKGSLAMGMVTDKSWIAQKQQMTETIRAFRTKEAILRIQAEKEALEAAEAAAAAADPKAAKGKDAGKKKDEAAADEAEAPAPPELPKSAEESRLESLDFGVFWLALPDGARLTTSLATGGAFTQAQMEPPIPEVELPSEGAAAGEGAAPAGGEGAAEGEGEEAGEKGAVEPVPEPDPVYAWPEDVQDLGALTTLTLASGQVLRVKPDGTLITFHPEAARDVLLQMVADVHKVAVGGNVKRFPGGVTWSAQTTAEGEAATGAAGDGGGAAGTGGVKDLFRRRIFFGCGEDVETSRSVSTKGVVARQLLSGRREVFYPDGTTSVRNPTIEELQARRGEILREHARDSGGSTDGAVAVEAEESGEAAADGKEKEKQKDVPGGSKVAANLFFDSLVELYGEKCFKDIMQVARPFDIAAMMDAARKAAGSRPGSAGNPQDGQGDAGQAGGEGGSADAGGDIEVPKPEVDLEIASDPFGLGRLDQGIPGQWLVTKVDGTRVARLSVDCDMSVPIVDLTPPVAEVEDSGGKGKKDKDKKAAEEEDEKAALPPPRPAVSLQEFFGATLLADGTLEYELPPASSASYRDPDQWQKTAVCETGAVVVEADEEALEEVKTALFPDGSRISSARTRKTAKRKEGPWRYRVEKPGGPFVSSIITIPAGEAGQAGAETVRMLVESPDGSHLEVFRERAAVKVQVFDPNSFTPRKEMKLFFRNAVCQLVHPQGPVIRIHPNGQVLVAGPDRDAGERLRVRELMSDSAKPRIESFSKENDGLWIGDCWKNALGTFDSDRSSYALRGDGQVDLVLGVAVSLEAPPSPRCAVPRFPYRHADAKFLPLPEMAPEPRLFVLYGDSGEAEEIITAGRAAELLTQARNAERTTVQDPKPLEHPFEGCTSHAILHSSSSAVPALPLPPLPVPPVAAGPLTHNPLVPEVVEPHKATLSPYNASTFHVGSNPVVIPRTATLTLGGDRDLQGDDNLGNILSGGGAGVNAGGRFPGAATVVGSPTSVVVDRSLEFCSYRHLLEYQSLDETQLQKFEEGVHQFIQWESEHAAAHAYLQSNPAFKESEEESGNGRGGAGAKDASKGGKKGAKGKASSSKSTQNKKDTGSSNKDAPTEETRVVPPPRDDIHIPFLERASFKVRQQEQPDRSALHWLDLSLGIEEDKKRDTGAARFRKSIRRYEVHGGDDGAGAAKQAESEIDANAEIKPKDVVPVLGPHATESQRTALQRRQDEALATFESNTASLEPQPPSIVGAPDGMVTNPSGILSFSTAKANRTQNVTVKSSSTLRTKETVPIPAPARSFHYFQSEQGLRFLCEQGLVDHPVANGTYSVKSLISATQGLGAGEHGRSFADLGTAEVELAASAAAAAEGTDGQVNVEGEMNPGDGNSGKTARRQNDSNIPPKGSAWNPSLPTVANFRPVGYESEQQAIARERLLQRKREMERQLDSMDPQDDNIAELQTAGEESGGESGRVTATGTRSGSRLKEGTSLKEGGLQEPKRVYMHGSEGFSLPANAPFAPFRLGTMDVPGLPMDKVRADLLKKFPPENAPHPAKKSAHFDVYGRPREVVKKIPNEHALMTQNNDFLIVEGPVDRRVRIASVASKKNAVQAPSVAEVRKSGAHVTLAAGQERATEGGRLPSWSHVSWHRRRGVVQASVDFMQTSTMQGLGDPLCLVRVEPSAFRFGYLRQGGLYRMCLKLRNLDVDACRFAVHCPRSPVVSVHSPSHLVPPGLHLTLTAEINAKEVERVGILVEVVHKAHVIKIPVTADILAPGLFDALDVESTKRRGRCLLRRCVEMVADPRELQQKKAPTELPEPAGVHGFEDPDETESRKLTAVDLI
uniref:Uncharacterized protein n=1 Tax=Chromera velia CCMP2878 TaxID=1169474 RepID=A0A0G4FL63_9ALVE|eukprot:Cvel_17583.t1-p1 / transcript=Cvel_17583.t1 / gene=Cvel_17583 / organism=Chromera_velia_CCMP2878 / gene_product=hypothetical protein / transcript_product=hypothetical protein / location=Cvel_scaffold1413:24272-39425(+) / protein_length=2580 / sequence_SO=supercontig / SO=protein_coding / is_pseudo=false